MMNRFLVVFLLAAMALPESQLDAQTVVVRKRNVDTETNSTSIKEGHRSRRYYENNATTISLMGLNNSHMSFGYERRLSDVISIEAGLGLTIDNKLDASYEYFMLTSQTNFYTSGNKGLGNSQFLCLKIHPQSNAMRNSPYIGFRGGRRQYIRTHGTSPSSSRTLFDVGAQAGYQVRSGEFWFADIFIGLNRLSTYSDRVSLSQVYDPDTQQIIDVVDINPLTGEYEQGEAAVFTRPNINFGFSLGFAF